MQVYRSIIQHNYSSGLQKISDGNDDYSPQVRHNFFTSQGLKTLSVLTYNEICPLIVSMLYVHDTYPFAFTDSSQSNKTVQPANSRQIILTVLLPLSPLLNLFSHILLVLTHFQMHFVMCLSIFLCYSQLLEETDV